MKPTLIYALGALGVMFLLLSDLPVANAITIVECGERVDGEKWRPSPDECGECHCWGDRFHSDQRLAGCRGCGSRHFGEGDMTKPFPQCCPPDPTT